MIELVKNKKIRIYLFFSIFLFTIGFTLKSFAVDKSSQLDKDIENVVLVLPPELREIWQSEFLDLQKSHFEPTYGPRKRCLKLTNVILPPNSISHQPAQEVKTINVSKSCHSTEISHYLKNDIYRIATEMWFKNQSKSQQNEIIHQIYIKRLLNIPAGLLVNFDQNLENIIIDFLSLLFQHTTHQNLKTNLTEHLKTIEKINTTAQVKILAMSDEAWFYRYKLVTEAKESITIQTYSMFDDLYGRTLVALLIDAMSRGVKVRLMLDGRGSILIASSGLIKLLKDAGADVRIYNPLFFSFFNPFKYFKTDFIKAIVSANHDKIFLVDKNKAIVGGRNIGARYFTQPGEVEGLVYQDMDVYLQSEKPLYDALIAFNAEFYSQNTYTAKNLFFNKTSENEKIQLAKQYMNSRFFGSVMSENAQLIYAESDKIVNLNKYKDYDFSIPDALHRIEGIDKFSSIEDRNLLTSNLIQDIDEAKESIMIINPYVILTKEIKAAFKRAFDRNKNMKIQLITVSPKTTDSVLTQSYFIADWKNILKEFPKISIYAYTGPGNLHAKIFIFDQQTAYVGSYNLDKLSQNINSEFNFKIYSEEIVAELIKFIEQEYTSEAVTYNLEKNVGPAQADYNGKYAKMKRLSWVAKILGPWL